jgi:hypothetical protein
MRATELLRGSLVSLSIASLCLLGGCEKKPKPPVHPVADNHPTINLFGFEESELHHIHNTVELHRNIFLVHYDPATPDRIEWVNCPIDATYQYQRSAGRRVESMYVRSFADLQARVPVNYARFEAYVKGGKALEFNYVTIGSYELLGDFKIPKDDPDCQSATHYVVTLSVGAFNFAEAANVEGGVAVEAGNTGVGVGTSAGRASGESTSMGDLSACMDDGTAALDCFTPLQLMMVPLAARNWDDGTVASSTSDAPVAAHSTTTTTSSGATTTTAGGDLSLRIDENSWRPGSYMATALERLLIVASRVDMTTDFGFDDKGSTVVAGYLRAGRPQHIERPFEAGKTYAIFAAGATEANIDLMIYDSAGNIIAGDDETDGRPAVTFIAPADDSYKIELSVIDQDEEFGAIVVMQDGGLRVEANILQSVFQRLLDSGELASNKVQEMGFPNGLVFHENDWAVQGVILYPGEKITQRGIDLASNSAVFAAVAHEDTFNIDLGVKDVNSGQVWADTEPDSNPVVIVDEPDENSDYELEVIYGEGDGPTLATSLILRLSD